MNQSNHPGEDTPSEENHSENRPSSLSKRFISRKIEEMLQSQPKTSPGRSPQPPSDPLLDSEETQPDQEKSFLFRYPLLVFLAIVVAAGWLIFFLQHYRSSPSLTDSIQIEKFAVWDNNAPLLSTPIIFDIDGDGEFDIAFADSLGYLRAVNPRTRELIYQTYLGGTVVASLAEMEVNGKTPAEVFAIGEDKFFTINQQGGYLYQSREEYFFESIFSKPLVLQKAGVFYLAGMAGRVWGVGIDYGEVLWLNDNSDLGLNNEGIFASPVFLPLTTPASITDFLAENPGLFSAAKYYLLVTAGERGTIAAFDLATGGLRWQSQLQDSFKATPSVLGRGEESFLLLAGVRGGIWLLNNQGEVINQVTLSETFIASPVKGNFLSDGTDQEALLIAESGNVFVTILTPEGEFRVEQLQSGSENFIATPVVADLNHDGRDDIIAVSRQGTLSLWEVDPDIPPGTENRLRDLVYPYQLGYKVTATPVLGDLNRDGHVEMVIGGENGRLSVLTLRISPPMFSPGELLSPQFLRDSTHER